MVTLAPEVAVRDRIRSARASRSRSSLATTYPDDFSAARPATVTLLFDGPGPNRAPGPTACERF